MQRLDRKFEFESLNAAVEQVADAILVTDTTGVVRYANPAFSAMTGYSQEEVIGLNTQIFQSGIDPDSLYTELWRTIKSGNVWCGEVTSARKDGTHYLEEMRIFPSRDCTGQITGYIAFKHELAQQCATQEALSSKICCPMFHSEGKPLEFTSIHQYCTDRKSVERRLQESEALCHQTFEYAPVSMWVTGIDGTIKQVNQALSRTLGYSVPELVSKTWMDLCHPNDTQDSAYRCMRLSVGAVSGIEVERRLIRKDGAVVWCDIRISVIRDANEQPLYFVGHAVDITERKRAQSALRESEERFRGMADACPSMMWVSEESAKMQFFNAELRAFCNITSEEALADKWLTLIHPDDVSEAYASFLQSHQDHTPFSTEVRLRRTDGQWRIVGTRAQPRFSAEGQFMGHIGLCADITDRREAEQALRASQEFAQSTIDALSSHICVTDDAGTIIAVNKAWREFANANRKNGAVDLHAETNDFKGVSVGANYLDVCDRAVGGQSEHAAGFAKGIRSVVEGLKGTYSIEYPCHSPSEERWFQGRVTKFLSNGRPRVVIEHIDITERKRVEQSLLQAKLNAEADSRRSRFQNSLISAILEVSPDGILVVDKGVIVLQNDRFWDIWQIDRALVRQQVCDEGIGLTDKVTLSAIVDRVKDSESFLRRIDELYADPTAEDHCEIELKDGQILERHSASLWQENGSNSTRVWFFRDITDRRRAEEAVRTSEARLRGITDSAQDAIVMMDPRGRISYWNPAAEELFGYTNEEAIGKGLHHLLASDESREAHEKVFPLFLRAAQGAAIGKTLEMIGRRKDGKDICIDLSLSGVLLNNEWNAIGILRDVSTRKLAEQKLKNSEEKFRELAENIREAFWMMDPTGTQILYISPDYIEIWGRS